MPHCVEPANPLPLTLSHRYLHVRRYLHVHRNLHVLVPGMKWRDGDQGRDVVRSAVSTLYVSAGIRWMKLLMNRWLHSW